MNKVCGQCGKSIAGTGKTGLCHLCAVRRSNKSERMQEHYKWLSAELKDPTSEVRKKIQESKATPEAREKKRQMMIERYRDPEKAKKYSIHWTQGRGEKCLESVLLFFKFPFTFCGCGEESVWIDGRLPDFLRIDGEKQVIEFAGGKWIDKETYSPKRTSEWRDRGYEVLILDFDDLNDFGILMKKLLDFTSLHLNYSFEKVE